MKISYQQLIEDSRLLADEIKEKYDYVFGIPSGGIAPAMIFSGRLSAKMLSAEEILNYAGDKKKVLIIDDLIDSGRTLNKYLGYDSAVLYKKPHSPKPTYYLKDIPAEWVSFPHEKGKTGVEEHIIRLLEYYNQIPSDENIKKLFILLSKTYGKN